MNLTRAQLLKTGISGALLLGVARCTRGTPPVATFWDDAFAYRVLSPAQRAIAASICAAMLAGALPVDAGYPKALRAAVRGFDTAVAGLQPGVQDAVGQLFDLLESPVTRIITTGIVTSIASADVDAVAAFLERWRFSRITVLRSAYGALHQLVYGAWYGQERAWSQLGYPGPPKIA